MNRDLWNDAPRITPRQFLRLVVEGTAELVVLLGLVIGIPAAVFVLAAKFDLLP